MPVVIDVRVDDDYNSDQRLVPTAVRAGFADLAGLLKASGGRETVILCQKGLKLSEGAAALLRCEGIAARSLEGGFLGWKDAGLPLVPVVEMPPATAGAGTVWVTRERPKIDRLACPWLIRRFVDANARFLFVKPSEVSAVAEKFGATAFDIEDVRWSHNGPECTFDTMVKAFGLATPALLQLATIVRGADTASPELAPQAAGLLAISLGLSRNVEDDLAQLDAGMVIYDALYRWCRDATDETHNWPARRGGA